jgi:hypothetical protein
MSRFFERFEVMTDTLTLASLLVGLPIAVGAVILASI